MMLENVLCGRRFLFVWLFILEAERIMKSNKIPKSILMKTLKARLHIQNDQEEKFYVLLSDAMKMLGIGIIKFSKELNISHNDLALWMYGLSAPNLIEQNHIKYFLLGHYLSEEQINKQERFERRIKLAKEACIGIGQFLIIFIVLELIVLLPTPHFKFIFVLIAISLFVFCRDFVFPYLKEKRSKND
jgi:hypothetical protein